jgi:hypothetical protein
VNTLTINLLNLPSTCQSAGIFFTQQWYGFFFGSTPMNLDGPSMSNSQRNA